MTRASLPRVAASVWLALLVIGTAPALAHNGPPFPILSNQAAGPYKISIWTDPDTTDDGTAAGQFWVVLEAADGRTTIPPGTQVRAAIRPLGRSGPTQEGSAAPVNGAVDRQFVALLMDHEGPFGVRVTVDGALGRAEVESKVDATYDARPPLGLVVLYLFPFVALGALWAKVLLRRRSASRR
jgi:hypothetical protein